MCGIVGFVSEHFFMDPEGMLLLAHGNRHRGSEDGMGFADLENRVVAKTMTPLGYLMNGVPKIKPAARKGTVMEWDKAREKIEENAKGFLAKAKNSSFCFWHARSASAGEVQIANAHPIRLRKNVFYIHNGTLGDKFGGLRNWLHIMEGVDFHTETDSEIAARTMEVLIARHGLGNLEAVAADLATLFEGTMGILIRLDMKEQRAIVVSDGDRSLFRLAYTEGKKKFTVFISEPNSGVNSEFDKAERLHSGVGHYFIGKKGLVEKELFVAEDVTAGLADGMALLDKSASTVDKCDTCKEDKPGNIVRIPETTWDFCLSCYCTGAVDEKIDDLKKKEVAKELSALNAKWPWTGKIEEVEGSPDDLSPDKIADFLGKRTHTGWEDWMKMMNHKRNWKEVMEACNTGAA